MPELPEVETVKRGLVKLIVGKKIKSVSFDWPKGFPNSEDLVNKFLIDSVVKSIRRRAKVIIIELSSGYSLVIHLKMTGQLVFRGGDMEWGAGHPNDSLVGRLPDSSTRVVFTFIDDTKLFFNDQRKFGWARLIKSDEVRDLKFMKALGPEPLEPEFTDKIFIQRARRRNRSTIKATILDQTVLAGVGNIYADESLWSAKIFPGSRTEKISDKQLKDLRKAIVEVMSLSLEKGGSTDRNYVDAEGKRGNYLEFAHVFRRQGRSCDRCGSTIEKTKIASRGTHYCPYCQKVQD